MSEKTVLADFVAANLFNAIATPYGTCYWREGVEPQSGYVVIYPDGSHHHTYHYPPNWVYVNTRGEFTIHEPAGRENDEGEFLRWKDGGVPLAAAPQQEPASVPNIEIHWFERGD